MATRECISVLVMSWSNGFCMWIILISNSSLLIWLQGNGWLPRQQENVSITRLFEGLLAQTSKSVQSAFTHRQHP